MKGDPFIVRVLRVEDLPSPPPGRTGWPWTTGAAAIAPRMRDGGSWPLISVVTPNYNMDRFLEETLRSVLLQGYPNLEYIVMDGGSSDESRKIIEKYGAFLSRWASEPDRGQSHAINKGWALSSGDIVAYINSDDTYLPGALETAARFLSERQDVGLVYGKWQIVNELDGVSHVPEIPDFDMGTMLLDNYITQPTVFIRGNVLSSVGLLDESLHMAMDMDLWARIALEHKIAFIPQLLATFRIHERSKSDVSVDRTWPDILRIYEATFRHPRLPPDVRKIKREAYARLFNRIGEYYAGAGDIRKSILYRCRAASASPVSFLRTLLYRSIRYLKTW